MTKRWTIARGLTMIELVLGIAILALFGIGLSRQACRQDQDNINRQAYSFAQGLGYKLREGSQPMCQDYDSDGDGYVSCTVAVEGAQQPIAIECKSDWAFGTGCRMQRLSNLRQ
jgi:hypothetical protein